jgi:predicted RNA-binding protein with PIN domain
MSLILIDGYNFIRQISRFYEVEKKEFPLGRELFLNELERFGEKTKHEICVVFDGALSPNLGDEYSRFGGIDVVFTRRGVHADTLIIDLFKEKKETGLDIIVVTADRAVADNTFCIGGFVIEPIEFDEILRGERILKY